MFRRRLVRVLALGSIPLTMGMLPPECVVFGGLNAWNFRQISENGFDPADEAEDKNSYSWAMEHFVPDGAESGHVYVGTGNNLGGLLTYGVGRVLEGGDPREGAPVRPPEVRRYRPDLGEKTWERVLDYRDVEPADNFRTIGFRMMRAYRGVDGVNRLYAATFGEVPILWRSATGDPGTWEAFYTFETGSIRWLEVHRGLMYMALATDIPGTDLERVGRILATDGETVWSVVDDGFGNPDNIEVECLASFNGWLYAGTLNQSTGYEIWKFAGPDGDETPKLIVRHGGPDRRNDIAGTPHVFRGHLYMGSLIFQGGINIETFNGFKGFDIIRIDEDDNWETVVGKNGLSGYNSGFDYFTNAYNWWMEEHQGWLYASSYDQSALLEPLFANLPNIFLALIRGEGLGGGEDDKTLLDPRGFWGRVFNSGADLYKTRDGVNWYPVFQDGFRNKLNYGIRQMLSVGNDLYVGTANNEQGTEVWLGNAATVSPETATR